MGWRALPSPNQLSTPNRNTINALTSVTAVTPNDIWAVGYTVSLDEPYQTLILHWNGHEWSIVDSPNGAGPYNALDAVAAAGPDDVWAAGGVPYGFEGGRRPLSRASMTIACGPMTIPAAAEDSGLVPFTQQQPVSWAPFGSGPPPRYVLSRLSREDIPVALR